MKSHFIYTCVIMMLFVTSFSSGEIIQDGNWSYYGEAQGDTGWSSVSAWADGDGPGHLHIAGGWEFTYTTEAGEFSWEYYIYVFAEAQVWVEEEEWCEAGASAYAYADSIADSNELDTDDYPFGPIDVDLSDAGDLPDDPNDATDCGEDWGIWKIETYEYDVNEGVYAEHLVVAEAGVQQGCDNEAYSHADAIAWTDLW